MTAEAFPGRTSSTCWITCGGLWDRRYATTPSIVAFASGTKVLFCPQDCLFLFLFERVTCRLFCVARSSRCQLDIPCIVCKNDSGGGWMHSWHKQSMSTRHSLHCVGKASRWGTESIHGTIISSVVCLLDVRTFARLSRATISPCRKCLSNPPGFTSDPLGPRESQPCCIIRLAPCACAKRLPIL